MSNHRTSHRRAAFTLVELVMVLMIMGIIGAMAIPTLNIARYRVDAAAEQTRSVFMTAQRTSLTRQYDVIVSVDTVKMGLRIAEDVNNNGVIDPGEWKFWRPPGDGNRFSTPPVGLRGPVTTAVAGQLLTKVDNLPSVIFHRDGSSSSDAEVYMVSSYRGRDDWRLITLTRSMGRTELYRLVNSGAAARWSVMTP